MIVLTGLYRYVLMNERGDGLDVPPGVIVPTDAVFKDADRLVHKILRRRAFVRVVGRRAQVGRVV